jgi:predicted DNA-binding antitoxin AbrB/MazE fold protein
MAEIITAVYENGVLRPLYPLPLSEHKTVRLKLLPDDITVNEQQELIQLMVMAGLMRRRSRLPAKKRIPPNPISEKERRNIANLLGQTPGQSLSEISIAERGEW